MVVSLSERLIVLGKMIHQQFSKVLVGHGVLTGLTTWVGHLHYGYDAANTGGPDSVELVWLTLWVRQISISRAIRSATLLAGGLLLRNPNCVLGT